MAKGKIVSVYFCQNCGYESAKWMGQCPGCREWNTFVEETVSAKAASKGSVKNKNVKEPVSLSEIDLQEGGTQPGASPQAQANS